MRRTACFSCFVLLLAPWAVGCGKQSDGASHPASGTAEKSAKARPKSSGGSEVRTEMKGVDFRIDPSVVMEIRWLRGALVPTHKGSPPSFNDPGSFQVRSIRERSRSPRKP
jgi:hypothetical protein